MIDMTPPPAASVTGRMMIDSHEERIIRLESEFPLLSTSVAQLEVKVDGANSGIGDVKTALATHMKNSLDNTTQVLAKLTALETDKHQSDARWALVKKLTIPAIVVLTAVMTKFGERLYDWIMR